MGRARSDNGWLIAACVSVSLLMALAYGFSARPQFEAAAEIEIDPEGTGRATKDWWESESRRLRDVAFVSRVISRYDLAGSPELARGPVLTPLQRIWMRVSRRDRAVQGGSPTTAALLSRVSVREGATPIRFVVAVRAYDAKFTALVANAVVRTLIDEAAPPADDQADDPAEWLAARARAPIGDAAASDTTGSLDARRRGLEADLAQALSRKAHADDAAAEIGRMFEAVRRESALEDLDGPEIGRSQAVRLARRELAETDARRARLEESLGPRHPDVVAIHERLQKQREILAEQQRRFMDEARRAAEDSARRAREAGDSVAALRAQLSDLRAVPPPAAAPRSERPGHTVASTPGAKVASPAGDRKSPVRVVSPATAPLRPSFPDVGRTLALAVFTGLAIGLSLALVRSRLDPGRDDGGN